MITLKEQFSRHAMAVVLITLFLGWGSALAVQDTFTVDLDGFGGIVGGSGTGYNHGTWYYYPKSDRLVQWFYNGAIDRDRKKIVDVDLTIRVLDPKLGDTGHIEASVHWTKLSWPQGEDGPPLPDAKVAGPEDYITSQSIVQRRDTSQSLFINTSLEIPDYCPQWVAIEIKGENISVEGRIRHDCVDKQGLVPPTEDRDFGDAPEGAIAYPSLGVMGQFPTCVGVGPASWIEHQSDRRYFGPRVDVERDGNAGWCPAFHPDKYNQDEGMTDGDAGLLKPRAYTIKGPAGAEDVYPLIFTSLESLGNACFFATWGGTIDIEVHNASTDGREAYVNLLMDWDHDGVWEKAVVCGNQEVPEHVLVNFPVPNGYSGPLSGLNPPNFLIGPFAGYVWARFSITERPVPSEWNGDGVFLDGETEDYLLHVKEAPTFCTWEDGDDHKMHWAQLPDKLATGIDVSFTRTTLADDFRCAQHGPITDIHFWGSFKNDVRPDLGSDSLTFEVSIWSNQPADNLIPWSRPGELLWSKEIRRFSYDVTEVSNNIAEGWFEPSSKFYERGNHERTYQYNICLDPEDELFIQELGTTYWLAITEIRPENANYEFGWKTTRQSLQFSDASVWRHPQLGWMPMQYPQTHEYDGRRMDLSFVITGVEPVEDLDFGDAPDPSYPTLAVSNGARHTIVPNIYLGRLIDGERDGQPNANATGDDLAGVDDEDGVVFTTDLAPGEKAIVQVTASTRGVLNAWIDWNADGDWDDIGEHFFNDVTLAAGPNLLPFNVPVQAASGRTFARFRFSTLRGLFYASLAPDGEVEDYQVEILGAPEPPKPPADHLKWSQPPIERDLMVLRAPVYCGWDEPASATRPNYFSTHTWKVVADDFRCVGTMPVTSVHWWGSYERWQEDEPPAFQPDSWRIGFWTNVPADNLRPYSRPGRLLWVVNAPANRVEQERAGIDEFPQKPSETTFRYFLDLQRQEYFWQDQHLTSTRDNTFWISITAVYTAAPGPDYAWGWKTRPQPWQDGAVRAEFRQDDLRAGFQLDQSLVQPITNSLVCERLDKYDMAFELDTDPEFIKWEQSFTGIRDWPHYEDEESLATESVSGAPSFRQVVADDWRCSSEFPISSMVWWGSYIGYGYSACECQQMLPPRRPDYFLLSIWSDDPAGSTAGFGRPGRKLWEYKAESFDEVMVGFDKHPEPWSSVAQGPEPVYRYTVRLPQNQWFRQEGIDNIYWFSVVAVYKNAKTIVYPWGWTNHPYSLSDLQGLELLAHWKLDKTAGLLAPDSTGNGNDALLVNGPTWRPGGGMIGGAIDLDGRSEYLMVQRPTNLNFAPGSFSVSAWVYPRQTRGLWRAIMEYDRTSIYGNRFGLWLDSDGRFHFRVGLNTWQTPASLVPGQWYHLTAVYDAGTHKMRLYVDGNLEATATQQQGYTSPVVSSLTIGTRGSADDEFFDGLLDDIRIYGLALSDLDVLILSGAGANNSAVAGQVSAAGAWSWTQLLDQTGLIEDMSFMLFAEPIFLEQPQEESEGDAAEIIIYSGEKKK